MEPDASGRCPIYIYVESLNGLVSRVCRKQLHKGRKKDFIEDSPKGSKAAVWPVTAATISLKD